MNLLQETAQLKALAKAIPMGATSDLERRLLDSCFAAQREFVEDESSFLLGFCTRRAAKSWALCVKMYLAALRNQNSTVLYLSLTRESGSGAIWEEILKPLNERFSIGATFNETKLIVRLPNNSRIYIVGVDQDGEARKLLGRAPPLVCVDEAQDIRANIRRLFFETLKPALAQRRGQLVMTGTPSHVTVGYFYEVTSAKHPDSPLWTRRTWSWRDNPHVADAIAADIAATVAKLGPAYLESPEYLRQFEGKWILYSDELCYHFSPAKNVFSGTLPPGRYTHILAGDLGWTDASSLTVLAYSEHDPHLFIRYSEKKPKLDFTAFSEWADGLRRQFPIDREVIDGANKQGVQELNARLGHSFIASDKADKLTHMKLFDNDLATGRIVLDPARCQDLVDEWNGLIWDPKAKLKGVLVEDPRCQNHSADGALYGWRDAYNYLSEPLPEQPTPGSPEALAAEARRINEQIMAAHQARQAEQAMIGGGFDSWGVGSFF